MVLKKMNKPVSFLLILCLLSMGFADPGGPGDQPW